MQTTKGVRGQILRGTEKGGKTYRFDESHKVGEPAAIWFQESHEGLILFIELYTQACRWSQCTGCNLPSKCSKEHVDHEAIISQIYTAIKSPEVQEKLHKITKVIVSNNGSVLDEKTFSTSALMYLLIYLNRYLKEMRVLTLETRPEYVDEAELEILSRALAEGSEHPVLELAIGFEAFDDRIRNEVFMKGLYIDKFERMVEMAANHGFRLKLYMMQKPVPEMSNQEAIDDIKAAIEYFGRLKERFPKIEINMHLNPTYVARGTSLEEAFKRGEYSPPLLRDVAIAVMASKDVPISIYVGINDEGLAVEGGSFIREGDEKTLERLKTFNRRQDYRVLQKIIDRV